MIGNTNRNEPQYQMSDYLFYSIIEYLQKNEIKFSEFCKELKLSKYYLRKIMDRNIKMNTYRGLYFRLANHCNIEQDANHKLYISQPTKIN